jgi:hydroxyacylglutathione hydrolase
MEVIRVENKPINSNSFLVYQKGLSGCIIIDPGSPDCEDLVKVLTGNKLKPEYIILTHEHFDHIWGVKKLQEKFSCKVICSKACAERIVDKKKNMSVFYNQVGFELSSADILIENLNFRFLWHDIEFEFIESKGHSSGSVCISADGKLFTGDTIIRNHKTVFKLPGGSKKDLLITLDSLFLKFSSKAVCVYPGHGESFFWDEIVIEQFV